MRDALEGIGWREPAVLLGLAGRVSGGLEAARSKGVLGFDEIKVHTMTGGLVLLIYPMRCNVPCNSSRSTEGRKQYQIVDL